jgi:hypothetical protein
LELINMGTSLTGLTPATTYDALIKVGDNGTLSGTLKTLSDGLGNDSSLSLSTTAASLSGTLAVTGALNGSSADFSTNARFFSAGNWMEFATNVLTSLNNDGAHIRSVVSNVDNPTYSFTGDKNTGMWTPGADTLAFSTAGLERMRMTSDAYVRLASGSGGIQFNGDTAAANALDDYEEGTFTPTIEGSSTAGTATYISQVGVYTKIGRIVKFSITINYNSGTGTGNLRISNLPFTSLSGGANSAVSIGAFGDIALTAGYIATAIVPNNSQFIAFEQYATGGSSSIAVPYDAAGVMIVSGTYEV